MGIKSRFFVIALVFVWVAAYVTPNFIDFGNSKLAQNKLKYGLDLQGGLHLVMGVDIDGVVKESAQRLATTVEDLMKKENVAHKSVVRDSVDPTRVVIEMVGPEQAGPIKGFLDKNYKNLQVIEDKENHIIVKYLDNFLLDLKKRTLDQAIETIRNRIDEFGVAEPSITAQGDNRILIQLPGIADTSTAKSLINRTARLEFQIVDERKNPVELEKMVSDAEQKGNFTISSMKYSEYVERINKELQSQLPDKTAVMFMRNEKAADIKAGRVPYLLRTDTNLGGEALKDAFVHMDEYGSPAISLSFNAAGAVRFADLTGANIKKAMAIVLDQVVYSAPTIQGKIAGGSAQITLGSGRNYDEQMREARSISMALRAGALPARLEQLEERTVGPSLGADAIHAGAKAAIIGSILIALFMLVYYKAFGVLAIFVLMLNLAITFAVLSALKATLTLPGIAGIALTVATAVDANVIIFERIKEELRRGASFAGAIDSGFDKAFSAIIDGNVTNILTCFVLVYFGTGPVRGFGVTLIIGIASSMFTAIFVSRTILDYLVGKKKVAKLSI